MNSDCSKHFQVLLVAGCSIDSSPSILADGIIDVIGRYLARNGKTKCTSRLGHGGVSYSDWQSSYDSSPKSPRHTRKPVERLHNKELSWGSHAVAPHPSLPPRQWEGVVKVEELYTKGRGRRRWGRIGRRADHVTRAGPTCSTLTSQIRRCWSESDVTLWATCGHRHNTLNFLMRAQVRPAKASADTVQACAHT